MSLINKQEQIVRLLLLAAFCNNSSRTPITVQKELMRLLAVQIDIMFDSMTQSELAVCFAGTIKIFPIEDFHSKN